METHLTIKHLAGYLPYGLNVVVYEKWANYSIDRIVGMDDELVYFKDSPDYYFNCDEPETNIKPIIRPLSDLTKEIEVNGEKFVPLDELVEKGGLKLGGLSKYGIEKYIKRMPIMVDYWAIERLLSWHFDIHGLIEAGLAIDINTL